MDDSQGRLLNVSLLAGSGAHRAYYDRSGSSVSELTEDELAAGFPPRPALNLQFFGGRTIAHLVYAALAKAMSDNDLQSVIQQYYDAPSARACCRRRCCPVPPRPRSTRTR